MLKLKANKNIININQRNKQENNEILITGGIGDFLALDYFYDMSNYKTIYIITAQADAIKTLIEKFINYKSTNIVAINCNIEFGRKCFFSLSDINKTGKVPMTLKQDLKFCHDYSILIKFPELRSLLIGNKLAGSDIGQNYKKGKFVSSLVANKLVDIDGYNLPDKYFFVCHYSENTRYGCTICNDMHDHKCSVNDNERNYIDIDWENTIDILNINKMKGVVIGKIKIPDKYKSNCFIDLVNKTNILESFEILKNAKGYIGIDTCFAVIASKLFIGDKLIIKSINKHGVKSKDIYYHNNSHLVDVYSNIPQICQ